MRLHFKEYGHGDPMIILHGLFGSSDNWHGIAPKLAECFQVFCLDLRNHGHSPHSAEMNFTAMAEDVAKFIETHRLADVVLLGHSLGGKVAMQLALSHPRKLKSLVVVDMSPRAYTPVHEPIIDALLALDLNEFHGRAQIKSALAASIPDLGTRRFLLKNVAGDGHGTFRWKLNLQDIRDNYARLNEAISAEAGTTFEKPALFVRGGRSDHVGDADWVEIQQMFPVSKLVTIPEAGHWVHADSPDPFVVCLRDFLG